MRGSWLVVLGLVALLAASGRADAPEGAWRSLARGLEYRSVRLGSGSFPAMHQLRLDLAHHRLALSQASDPSSRLQTVSALRTAAGALAAVNAGYFDEAGRPLGYLRQGDRLIVPDVATGSAFTGVLVVRPDGARILHRGSFQPGRMPLALQAGPRLVAAGRPVQGLEGPARRRTGVAVDRKGRVVLYATDPGGHLTLEACRDLLLRRPERGGVQPADVLNLDGGSSTGFSLSAGGLQVDRPAYTLVPVALVVLKR